MKKLFLTLLLLGNLPALGMEESDFVLKEDGRSITITEPIYVTTSDGVRFEFSPKELELLNSCMLNDFLEEFYKETKDIPLPQIDAATLTIIKNILEKGLDETLSSYKDDWSYLIDALEFLGAKRLLDDVCKWVANCDFKKFDGINIFSTFIKQRRSCYPLQKALVRKLYSTEGALLFMSKNSITLEYALDDKVAIAADNSFIVTGSYEGKVKVWRLDEKHEVVGKPITIGNTDAVIFSVAIASDNSFIVTGSEDHTAKIWRLDENHELVGRPIELRGHTDWVTSVAIASDNSFIVTGSTDSTLLTGSGDGTAKIWRLNDKHELLGRPITLNAHGADSVAIAGDNSFVVTGSYRISVKVWQLDENHEVVGRPTILARGADSIAIVADSSFIVTAPENMLGRIGEPVKIWRNLTSEELELDLAQILVLLKIATFPSRITYVNPDFYAIYESLPKSECWYTSFFPLPKNDSRLTQFCQLIKLGKPIEKMSSIGMAMWFAYKNFITRIIHETPKIYDSLPKNLKRIVDE